jgi:Cu-processing system permease protein
VTWVTVLRFELQDLRRSRWLLGYTLCLFLLTEALLRFGGGGPRAVLSLMNVVLGVVPLVGIVFGTMYLYGSRSFIRFLLAQPVGRGPLFTGLYGGLALPLTAGFLLAVGLPFLWDGAGDGPFAASLIMLLAAGTLLTLIFTALAMLVSLKVNDRARGLGLAILVWLTATALYDAVIVLVGTAFSDASLELPLLGLTVLNPIDLARVAMLLRLDTAALMGYTGAVFERFFGSVLGMAVSVGALLLWWAAPLWAARRRFCRNDF